MRQFNLKTAVQVGEVMQDFELELHPPNVNHSQTVKATFGGCSYSSKGCVNLPASTAVFRFKGRVMGQSLTICPELFCFSNT